ncbi:MAG TPA: NADH-quinone oxidoreductase subunit M, partial [Burkholderiales bacterium]|nr:NADH-quinone oxidoreductase subunit M [Burkholderiales bacterium]
MLLSAAIWIPIVAGAAVLAVGEQRPQAMRWTALAGALVGFLVTIPIYTGFDASSSAMQFVEMHSWIEHFHVNYHLGVDGISLPFVLL